MSIFERLGFGNKKEQPKAIPAFTIPPELEVLGADIYFSETDPDAQRESGSTAELAAEAVDLFAKSIKECTDLDELNGIRSAVKGFYFGRESGSTEDDINTLLNARALELDKQSRLDSDDEGDFEGVAGAV